MEQEQIASIEAPEPREKLGLALAGGGFRAALFHLGVLRRLAHLDVLRRVEVISTVSGGSIVGALYHLTLKRELEAAAGGKLSRDDYVAIVDDVERDLLRGIGKNLRTLLLMNPLGVLRVLLTSRSLGWRMARLYERYVFRRVVGKIRDDIARSGEDDTGWAQERWTRPGWLPLQELRIRPGRHARSADSDLPSMDKGLEHFNRTILERLDARPLDNSREAKEAGAEKRPAVSTRLVLNATSLNSGGRFWFSSSEVGDWYLGHVRHSEIDELQARKRLMDLTPERLEREVAERLARKDLSEGGNVPVGALRLALWLKREAYGEAPSGSTWDPLFGSGVDMQELATCAPGLLRQAKLPAWYLTEGRERGVTGGRTPEEHWLVLRDALGRIDGGLKRSLEERVGDDPGRRDLLARFLVELYLLRSAALVHGKVERFWRPTYRGSETQPRWRDALRRSVSVGDAVGASANFPPVFPPYQILGLYDDLHVQRLGLTDGGVYDNMGLTALEDEGCTQVIASDTSGVFEDRAAASTGRVRMMTRVVSVLQKAVASNARVELRERRRVTRKLEGDPRYEEWLSPRMLSGLAYFHIDSDRRDPSSRNEAYPESPVEPEGADRREQDEHRRALAGLRTDLDAFGEAEIAALVNQGYATADGYLRYYLGEGSRTTVPLHNLFWEEDAPERPREPPIRGEVRQLVLEAGGRRFFRALRVFAPASWLFALAALAALVAGTWGLELSVRSAADGLSTAVLQGLAAMTPWLSPSWAGAGIPVGQAVVAALVLFLLIPWVTGIDVIGLLRRSGLESAARRIATARKLGRSFAGLSLLLLGLFPVALAFLVAALALISHLFFSLPYRAATDGQPGGVRTWLIRRFSGGGAEDGRWPGGRREGQGGGDGPGG